MRGLAYLIAAAVLVSPAAPAFSQQTGQAPAQAKAAPDPNQVVCEKEQDTGSRLATHRVCMTRAEWAEQRRLNRQDIDKIQTQRPCNDVC